MRQDLDIRLPGSNGIARWVAVLALAQERLARRVQADDMARQWTQCKPGWRSSEVDDRLVLGADQINVRVLRNGAEIPLTFSLRTSPPR